MSKYSYTIEQDTDASNPRDEWDNLSTFYGSSSRYNVGGKKDVEYLYSESLKEQIEQLRKEKAVIVEFSSNAGTCYAVVERSQLKKEYLDYRYSMRKALYYARKSAQGEIDTFLAWANGEVYGYQVKGENGEILDSCWGFYGEWGYEEAEKEAKAIIADYEDKDTAEDNTILARLQLA